MAMLKTSDQKKKEVPPKAPQVSSVNSINNYEIVYNVFMEDGKEVKKIPVMIDNETVWVECANKPYSEGVKRHQNEMKFYGVNILDDLQDDNGDVLIKANDASFIMFGQYKKDKNFPVIYIPKKNGEILQLYEDQIVNIEFCAGWLAIALNTNKQEEFNLFKSLLLNENVLFLNVGIYTSQDEGLDDLNQTMKSLLEKILPKHKICYNDTLIQRLQFSLSCRGRADALKDFTFLKSHTSRIKVPMMNIFFSFIADDWKLGKKELKKKINGIKDVPAFINNFRDITGGIEAEDFMKHSMKDFLTNHECIKCRKYTLDKCSICKKAHYCGRDCQEKDYERHSKECNVTELLLLRRVETNIKERLDIVEQDKNFLTIYSFMSTFQFKIFESCFKLLAIKKPNQPNKSKATCFESHFKGLNRLDKELRVLLRNQPVPLDIISEQLSRANIDCRTCKPNQSAACDIKERKQNRRSRRRIHA